MLNKINRAIRSEAKPSGVDATDPGLALSSHEEEYLEDDMRRSILMETTAGRLWATADAASIRRHNESRISSGRMRALTIRAADLLVALLVLSAGSHCALAQSKIQAVTVNENDSTERSLPIQFYGVNGQGRNLPWDQNGVSEFTKQLRRLHLGLLRFPGGTVSNFWDWSNYSKPSFATGGDFIGSFYFSEPSVLSPLSELRNELRSATQRSAQAPTAPVFALNVLTDPAQELNPACDTNPPGIACAPTPNSPDLSYQLKMLQTALAPDCPKGTNCEPLTIPYIELGNEFYFVNPCFTGVYPDTKSFNGTDLAGLNYAKLLVGSDGICPKPKELTSCRSTNWVTQIRSAKPNVRIAAVAADVYDSTIPRIVDWNRTFLSAQPIPAVDALTLHIYRPTGLKALGTSVISNPAIPFGAPDSQRLEEVAATMLAVPFHTMEDLENVYITPFDNSTTQNGQTYNQSLRIGRFVPDIWITEYNLDDGNYAAFGTWAHGLYLAAMSLTFLESPRIKMAIHHEALGTPQFADIFESNHGFGNAPGSNVSPSTGNPSPTTAICNLAGQASPSIGPAAAMDTTPFGFTAGGVAQIEVNTAALGHNRGKRLAFAMDGKPGPVITDPTTVANSRPFTYPALYGWIFYGEEISPEIIILNLAGISVSLDVSSIAKQTSTYRQIFGFPGDYLTGNAANESYEAFYVSDDGTAHADEISVMSGHVSTPHDLSVPAYSLTRITLP